MVLGVGEEAPPETLAPEPWRDDQIGYKGVGPRRLIEFRKGHGGQDRNQPNDLASTIRDENRTAPARRPTAKLGVVGGRHPQARTEPWIEPASGILETGDQPKHVL